MAVEIAGESIAPFGYSAPDYVIRKSGSTYIGEPRHGLKPLADTSLNQVWLDVYSEVAEPVIQFSRGEFAVDAPLEILGNRTKVYGMGRHATVLKLDDSVDDDVMRLDPGNYYHDCDFENFTINANKANNAAGRGFEWHVTVLADAVGVTDHMLRMYNVNVWNSDEVDFYYRTTTGSQIITNIESVKFEGGGGVSVGGDSYNVYIERMFDSSWGGGWSNINSAYTTLMNANTFNNIYCGVGNGVCWSLQGNVSFPSMGNTFSGMRFDNPTEEALKVGQYAWRNIFNTNFMTNFNQTGDDDTHPAVEVDGLYNGFVGNWLGHNNITNANRWRVGFEELANADGNNYIGNQFGYGDIGASGNNFHFVDDDIDLSAGGGNSNQEANRTGTQAVRVNP